MISWIHRLFSKRAQEQYNHDKIINKYYELGCTIGNALSYIHMGEPYIELFGHRYSIRDNDIYDLLNAYEEEYASLGYRIVPLYLWIDHAGWGHPKDDFWLKKMEPDEEPIFSCFNPDIELPGVSTFLNDVFNSGKSMEMSIDEDGEMSRKILEED